MPLAAARSRFVLAVRRALFGSCGVDPGAEVIVGVSGGADSMALMLALAAIARRSTRSGGVRPVVVHVHHHLRGRPADLDAAFVGREAARLDLPFVRCDVHPARERGSRAAAARRLRYAALADVARTRGASTVAVAHHAEDQLETILMALGRGTGLAGLAGMANRRPLDEAGERGLRLVRPLLGVRRHECEAFCRLAGRTWRRDASNKDRASPRVRLRQDVLPVLEALWPGAAVRASALADAAREMLSLVAELAPRPLTSDGGRIVFDRRSVATSPASVTAWALQRAFLQLSSGPDAEPGSDSRDEAGGGSTASHLAAAHVTGAVSLVRHGRSGMGIAWPGGVRVRLERDLLILSRAPARAHRE